jgi:hypothetical protein
MKASHSEKNSNKSFIKEHPRASILIWCFVGILVVGALQPPESKNNEYMASLYCQTAVGMKLKDESSAQFSEEITSSTWGNWWEVAGKVSATNSFNARVKSLYYCKLEYSKEKNGFNLLDFKITK